VASAALAAEAPSQRTKVRRQSIVQAEDMGRVFPATAECRMNALAST
jgi:hypothetical protein